MTASTGSTGQGAARPTRGSSPTPRGSLTRTVGAALAGLLVGFLAAFAWQYPRAERLQRTAGYASRALEAARLEATLASAVIEAEEGRYEIGRQRVSAFFTGVQRRLTPRMTGDAAAEMRGLLARRDATVTALARNDPASASVLAETLVRYRELVRRSGLDSAVVAPPPD